jgi:hypothetical protein
MFPPGNQPPTSYDPPAEFDGIIREKDIAVAMRDGVNLAVDVLTLPAAAEDRRFAQVDAARSSQLKNSLRRVGIDEIWLVRAHGRLRGRGGCF